MKKLFVVLLFVALVFSACSKSAQTSGSGGSDTLIWVQNADITSLDPHVGRETAAITVTGNIFDSLLAMVDGTPEPGLAERWENISPTTWRFYIRKNVKFHDGTPLTAADIKFSLDRSKTMPQVRYISNVIESVQIIDDYTIELATVYPYAPILANLSMPMVGILPKHLVEKDEAHFILNPVGTGPYKFVRWNRGEGAVLEANPDYFRGAPLTKNLQMRVVPEAAQRTIALETGEAHLALDMASIDAAKVRANPNLTFIEALPVASWFLIMNMNKPPLNDVRVRQAIHYAINTPEILTAARYGLGLVAHSFIPPSAFGHSKKAKEYNFDLEKAKQLMKEAGVENINLSLYVSDASDRIEVCQIIQAQLLQIGINANIRVLEFGVWLDQTGKGEHDLTLMVWSIPTLDADYNYYSLYHSSQAGTAGNRAFLKDEKVDRLIMEGRTTVDRTRRQEIYDELAAQVSEISPCAYVFFAGYNVGASNKVKGLKVDPNGYHRFHTVRVE